jgi:spore maturation protein CgeB
MKILVVRGAFGDSYEPAWCRALTENGHNVIFFDSHEVIGIGLLCRIQKRINFGLDINRMRGRLLDLIKYTRPNVTLFYQGHYFDAETINSAKKYTFVVGYHNDDPFGPRKNLLRYRVLNRAISCYDGFHFYRIQNVLEAKALGLANSELLLPYFIPSIDFPRRDRSVFSFDVCYIGHFEDDIRSHCLNAAHAAGYDVLIRGEHKYWAKHLSHDFLRKLTPLTPVYGVEYREILSSTRIAACFFSKWNRDVYTRRSFEIPACGAFMLSERTQEMSDLFTEGVHCDYFSNVDEFTDKCKFYIANERIREKIAAQGRSHVISNGHDINSRLRQWVSQVEGWMESRS